MVWGIEPVKFCSMRSKLIENREAENRQSDEKFKQPPPKGLRGFQAGSGMA